MFHQHMIEFEITATLEQDYNVVIRGDSITFPEGMLVRPKHIKLINEIQLRMKECIRIQMEYCQANDIKEKKG